MAILDTESLRRTLNGRGLALEPLEERHHAGLRAAADLETFRYFVTPDFDSWLARRSPTPTRAPRSATPCGGWPTTL